MKLLDIMIYIVGAGLGLALIYIIYSYYQGLKGSPRELFILFIAKIFEYSAYAAANYSFVLYLSADCGLSDTRAGWFIGIWSMGLTLFAVTIGTVVDAIGVRKTLLTGAVLLVLSRIALPLSNNFLLVAGLSFLPMAIGMGVLLPVLSVGIKQFTTKEGSALGFGMFYTLMNIGYAIGAWIFDLVRHTYGEHTILQVNFVGLELSTYQVIFFISLLLCLPNIFLMYSLREGVQMTDDRGVVITPPVAIEAKGGFIEQFLQATRKALVDTGRKFAQVFFTADFWVYLFLIGLLVFVRLVFYHFHYTFPKYGIRILGEGVKIGNIYGVLNPVMIVFLVPLVASLTKKISSYKVMLVGTTVSALAVFIAVIPSETFAPLIDTWVGELIYDRWLDVPPDQRNPLFLTLVIFVFIFTIGESIWSPRLMQFTAEVAPKGHEGTYISLSYLPFFLAKLIAGPLSGWLLATYIPEGQTSYPHQYMVWIWIGGMAIISPLSLFVFGWLYRRAEAGKPLVGKA